MANLSTIPPNGEVKAIRILQRLTPARRKVFTLDRIDVSRDALDDGVQLFFGHPGLECETQDLGGGRGEGLGEAFVEFDVVHLERNGLED